MRRAPLFGVVLALAMCGCGDDEPQPAAAHTPEPTVSAATKAWAKRADAVCMRHQQRLDPIGQELQRAAAAARSTPNHFPKRLVKVLGRLDHGLTAVFDDLRKLPKPADDKRPGRFVALYGQMVSDFHWGVDYGRIDDVGLSNSYMRSAEKHGSEAHETAHEIGVSECTPALSGPGS
jgi:hypothetical protein